MSDYKFYKTLRQNPPIKINNVWFISRYKDVKYCLNNTDIFSSNKYQVLFSRSNISEVDKDLVDRVRINLGGWLLFADYTPELVKVKRKITNSLNRLTSEEVNRIVDESLTKSLANIDSEEINLKTDIIVPMLLEFAKVVMNIREDIDPKEAYRQMHHIGTLIQTNFYEAKDIYQFEESLAYMDALIPEDVVGLEKATHTIVLYALVFNLANMIGNTLVTMYTNNREWDFTKIFEIITESTRLQAPLRGLLRIATIDTEIGGVSIKKDDVVSVIVGSANRDETVYGEDADIFRLDRKKAPIITFGIGMHACLGRQLSLDIGEVAIPKIWDTFKDYTFQEVNWDALYGQRSAKSILIKANANANANVESLVV